ncbi:MAG: acetyl-CoA decarbonylase/synthase complex subunit delta [Candidatus Omnitrophica bacterium]|nr:acetyl-CoA decarbonylase/synthase complex subunit delta [Candidatus Omnitrophota bacterium]
MGLELVKEKWASAINVVQIGAAKEDGGTRTHTVKAGGESTLAFLEEEGGIPHRPLIAYEVWDIEPGDWPDELKNAYGKVLKSPLDWALKCVNEFKAGLLCLRLQGAHPDSGDRTADASVKLVKELLKATGVPLIILGCGDDAKDNQVLVSCSQAAAGERCLIGDAVQENYKTLAAAVIADGHSIIAESPIDINIAKQLNILISDMGVALDKIVINPTIGSLGYGLEYAYSIMERARLAALSGDKMMQMPFICFVGYEAWRAKEAKSTLKETPEWGDEKMRAPLWEALTASALLQAGADILVMRHPMSIKYIEQHIDELMK